jgi:phage repressor protein C with HTH and peptisase S24 domain
MVDYPLSSSYDDESSPRDVMALGDRLREEMAKAGINGSELAKRSGVKPSFIYDIISGKSGNPSTVKLARVAEGLGISLNQLIGQQAVGLEAGISSHAPEDEHDFVVISSIRVQASMGGGSLVTVEKEGEPYYFRRSWIRDRLGVHPSQLRMIFVRGDSMEPTLCNNDIVLVDMSKKTPSPPGVFVLFDGFGLVAKRLEFLSNSNPPCIRIMSDNPQYSAYNRTAEETHIIGRVVWFAREI